MFRKKPRENDLRNKDELWGEVQRVEALVEQTRKRIHEPEVSLSERIRLNRRRTELEAYATGIRYALGDVDELQTRELNSGPESSISHAVVA